jgi:hypothetical protein
VEAEQEEVLQRVAAGAALLGDVGDRRSRTGAGRRASPEGGGREPAGDEEQEPRRTTTGVNTYPAFVHLSTEPATTPSLPHREQPNRPLYPLLPLGLLPVLVRDVETCRR